MTNSTLPNTSVDIAALPPSARCLDGVCRPPGVGSWLAMPPAWFRAVVWLAILVLGAVIAYRLYTGTVDPDDVVVAARNLNVVGVALLLTELAGRAGVGVAVAAAVGGIGSFVLVQGGYLGLVRVLGSGVGER